MPAAEFFRYLVADRRYDLIVIDDAAPERSAQIVDTTQGHAHDRTAWVLASVDETVLARLPLGRVRTLETGEGPVTLLFGAGVPNEAIEASAHSMASGTL